MSFCRPDILTANGNYWNFIDLEKNKVDILVIARALSNCCRFAGQTSSFYSVAQHSVACSYLVPQEHAMAALLHDAAEAYLGDVTRPLKQLLPDYKKIEAGHEAFIFRQLGVQYPFHDCVKQADLIMLATEQRDLMPHHDDDWPVIEGITPLVNRISPMHPEEARLYFLGRYWELYK